jgi:tetratricopeptide (TPR) repeat protein
MLFLIRLTTLYLLWTLGSTVAISAEARSATVKNSTLNSEIFYQLLVSEISAQSGDATSAFALMLDAARKSTSPRLYERAVELALTARSGESALQAAKAWIRAFPASREANRYQLQILIGLNRNAEILEPLKRTLAGLNPKEKTKAINFLPRYFARTTDKATAASVVQQALKAELGNRETGPAAWATIGHLKLAAGDVAGALEAARKGSALNPKAPEPPALALDLMGAQSVAAEELVRNHLATVPSIELRMAYTRKLLDAKRYDEAYAQVKRLTTERREFADAWLVRGSLEAQEKQWDAAKSSIQQYLSLAEPSTDVPPPAENVAGVVRAYLMLAEIAEQNGKLDEAIAYLVHINSAQDALQVDSRRAAILARQGKMAAAMALLRSIPEQRPEDGRAKLSLQVQLLRQYKLYPEAYQLLADAVANNPDDVDLIYDQAMMAEKLGNLSEMERMLRQIITAKPDYLHAYNALGYSLADRNMRLSEARELVKKALEFAPGDPFITDSLAWVEFRLGNTSEAITLLQSAYAAKPDAEIAAHLGEVLWVMGYTAQALDIWKQGSALNPENETLRETIQRLNPRP